MTKHKKGVFENVEVIPAAPEQQPILANLLQLYAHDFSEFHDVDLGSDGRFTYTKLSLYWREPERHPFLVKVDGRLAGFVLAKKGSEISDDSAVWDMAEFFVIRGCRRRGVGTRITHEVWNRFTGPWEVRVMESNAAARNFWARAISKFLGREIHPALVEKDGKRWSLFSFESKKGVASKSRSSS